MITFQPHDDFFIPDDDFQRLKYLVYW